VLAPGHHLEYASCAETAPSFNFCLGRNTLERKDSIMDKLVVPVDE
jgi:hypothetical protein